MNEKGKEDILKIKKASLKLVELCDETLKMNEKSLKDGLNDEDEKRLEEIGDIFTSKFLEIQTTIFGYKEK